MWKMLANFLTIGAPTIAMIDGHAFAAGFFFAIAHDFIAMKRERGYLCFNEMQFGAPSHLFSTILGTTKLGIK